MEVVYKQQDWAPADVADRHVDVDVVVVEHVDKAEPVLGQLDADVDVVEHVDKAEQVLGQLVVDLVGGLPMGK